MVVYLLMIGADAVVVADETMERPWSAGGINWFCWTSLVQVYKGRLRRGIV